MTSTFILGGARSGKSRHAQALAEKAAPERVYIATAEALDDEMRARIARHVADRDLSWQTVEAPLDLSQAISEHSSESRAILVDCLTLWLSNIMHAERDVEAETAALAETVAGVSSTLVLVSNEVGLGIVPESPLGREFRDAQGRLNQAIAAAANTVEFIAAGLPLRLKG